MLGWYRCDYRSRLQGKGKRKERCLILFPCENEETEQKSNRYSHRTASPSHTHPRDSGYAIVLFWRWVSCDWFIADFFSKPILIFSNSKQSNHKQKESFCDDSDEFLAISSITVRKWEIYPNIISFCRFIITRLYFIAIIWTLYLDTCAQRKPSHFWQFPFL